MKKLTFNRTLTFALLGTAMLWMIGPVAGLAQQAKPARLASPPAKAIWDYKSELGLTGQQVAQMKAITGQLQKEVQGYQQKLLPVEQEIRKLVDAHAAMDKIKSRLQAVAAIEVEMRCSDIQASWKLNDALTPVQLERWKSIRQKAQQSTSE